MQEEQEKNKIGRRRGKLGARPHCRDERTSPASLSQEGAREGGKDGETWEGSGRQGDDEVKSKT